jgi:hypothetical protein
VLRADDTLPDIMRCLASLGLALVVTSCAAAPKAWSPIQKPWTGEVIDVQRRVRVVPLVGEPFEVERPQYAPEGRAVLAWRGAGPDDRYPARFVPLAEVEDLLAAGGGVGVPDRDKLAQAGVVTLGVVLWGLLLLSIFA